MPQKLTTKLEKEEEVHEKETGPGTGPDPFTKRVFNTNKTVQNIN